MKIFSATGARSTRRQTTPLNCLLINQLGTPGLGSLMGGRIVAGTIQLSMAVSGFILVCVWFAQRAAESYHEFSDLPAQPARFPWLGRAGFLLFALSWMMAWFTSISLVRHAPKNNAKPKPVPPLIKP